MKEGYLLSIDAGTGSIRAIIFDLEGNQIGVSQREWSHISEEGVANSMGFDAQNNWSLVVACIKDVLKETKIEGSQILGVSATSMREGIVLYDKSKNELWGVANVDARSSDEVAELNGDYPDLEKEFYKESGQTFALGALPRLMWVKKNRPQIYEKTAYISMISDWVLARLSSVIAVDPSNGGTSGIFSLEKRDWDASMASKVGIKDTIFPKVYESGEKIGTVTAEVASVTGLKERTPVVMGGGDVQLGSAGLGVVEKSDAAILGGTFWQQIVNMPESKSDPLMQIRINPHVIPGMSQAEGITFFSGMVMGWFKNSFYSSESYEKMEDDASKIPVGSHGIIPIFSDAMNYGRWIHAAPSFLNLPLDENIDVRAAMLRSIQENTAIVSNINLQRIAKFTGVNLTSITFAGGASNSSLWAQILSDVTGLKVRVPKVKEATALGAAFAAGVGAGIYESIADVASKLVVFEKEYEPNMQNHEIYKKQADIWLKAYEKQMQLVDEGVTTPMWKAPGL